VRGVAAASAVALVLTACGSREPPIAASDPIEVVEAYIAARNGTDWDVQRSFLAGDARRHAFGSRDEFEAAVALDRDIHLLDCGVNLESDTLGSFVACTVEVTDLISEVSGRTVSNANASTFTVSGGFVVDLPEFLPSDFVAERAIEAWAEQHEPTAYRRACPDGIAGQSVVTGRRCAEFIAQHVDAWAGAVIDATK
jgi:hypothetical protein